MPLSRCSRNVTPTRFVIKRPRTLRDVIVARAGPAAVALLAVKRGGGSQRSENSLEQNKAALVGKPRLAHAWYPALRRLDQSDMSNFPCRPVCSVVCPRRRNPPKGRHGRRSGAFAAPAD